MTRRRRWLLLIVFHVVVLASGWWLVARGRADDAAWAEVTREDLVLDVEVEGTLQAVDTSLLGPPQVGELWEYKIAFMAHEGKPVKAGQPVLGFDTVELDQKLQETQAERDTALKQLEKRRADLELERRQRELRLAEARARERKAALKLEVPPELAAATELQKTRHELALAKDEVALLERQMAAAERSGRAAITSLTQQHQRAEERVRQFEAWIAAMQVTAPRDGLVIYVSNWRDEKSKVGDSVWRGQSVLEIPDVRRMKADGEVDEADAGKIQVGQRVTFHLDAHPDVEFRGTVAALRRSVQRRSWRDPLKVAKLTIELESTDTERMRPGMRFRGDIETERIKGAVLAPLEAVFPSSEGPRVHRRTPLGTEPVAVRIGKRNDEQVQILSGLSPGDRIARTDPSVLARAETP